MNSEIKINTFYVHDHLLDMNNTRIDQTNGTTMRVLVRAAPYRGATLIHASTGIIRVARYKYPRSILACCAVLWLVLGCQYLPDMLFLNLDDFIGV
jgi:hypothetical protein